GRPGAGGMRTLTAGPPPHGVTGRAASAASPITAATSSTDPGKTAASGVRPSTTYGESSTPVRTFGAPTAARTLSSSASGNAASPPALEALGEALFFDRVRPVGGGAHLAARLLGRKDLPGIAEPGRIERALQAVHERQIGRREDERHEVGFFESDPVLARDRSADLGAHLHDLGPGRHHARLVARLARIVEKIRVKVAVAGVEHVADAQAGRRDDLVHAMEDIRELRAWDDAIHDHVGRRD